MGGVGLVGGGGRMGDELEADISRHDSAWWLLILNIPRHDTSKSGTDVRARLEDSGIRKVGGAIEATSCLRIGTAGTAKPR